LNSLYQSFSTVSKNPNRVRRSSARLRGREKGAREKGTRTFLALPSIKKLLAYEKEVNERFALVIPEDSAVS
jgi:hypothetical protein